MPENPLLWSAELVSMVGGIEHAMVGGQQTNCRLGLQGVMSPCFKLQCCMGHDVGCILHTLVVLKCCGVSTEI